MITKGKVHGIMKKGSRIFITAALTFSLVAMLPFGSVGFFFGAITEDAAQSQSHVLKAAHDFFDINAYAATKRVKIKFNANGGKVSPESKKFIVGKKYGKLPAPKRSGYYFQGWYTKKSGGKKITKQSVVRYKNTKMLYAKWSRIPSKYLNKIGVTYHALIKKNKSLKQKNGSIMHAWMLCLGSPKLNYKYAFYGGQDIIVPLAKIAKKYGSKLKCAGIATKVGTLFPGIKGNLSFDEFFAYLRVEDYIYYNEEGAGQGWIVFSYQGYEVNLDTQRMYTTDTIRRTYPIVIWKDSIEESNRKLAGSFY